MLISFSQDLSVIYVRVKELTSNISDREPFPGPRRTVPRRLQSFGWAAGLARDGMGVGLRRHHAVSENSCLLG